MKKIILLVAIFATTGFLLAACGHSSETLNIPGLPEYIDGGFILEVPPPAAADTADDAAGIADLGGSATVPPPADEVENGSDEAADETGGKPHVEIDAGSLDIAGSHTYVIDADDLRKVNEVSYDGSAFYQVAEAEETEEVPAEDPEEVPVGDVPAEDQIVIISNHDYTAQRDTIKLPDQCKKHPVLCAPLVVTP